MSRSFRMGGIHPPEKKFSKGEAVERMPLPDKAVIPLSQHIGAPAEPVVGVGDKVRAGQLIGRATGFVSSNIHSSVSGTVISLDAVRDGGGMPRPAVTVRVEGDEWAEGIDLNDRLIPECDLLPEEIIARVGTAGIVGMGGATFPTHVKLSLPAGKKAEYLIINGAECEPYLTSDHRLMLERGAEMVAGARIIARALGVSKTYIGVENNKWDAIRHLRNLLAESGDIEVVPVRTRYPQGGEKQLIDAILHREVPSGGLPLDIGVIVQNVATAFAVYEAVQKNKPLVERIVTVTGKKLKSPKNLLVRIGTPVQALIDHCGGLPENTGKVIKGGPMMGKAMSNLDSVVTKGTSGIVVMRRKDSGRREAGSCIMCGKCVTVCPMGLEPYMLYKLGRHNMFGAMEKYYATDCIECGSCPYICPAALPLLDYIRLGKTEVMRIVRERKK